MFRILFFLILILISYSLNAQEPILKLYIQHGAIKELNESEIDQISFINSHNTYSMIISYKQQPQQSKYLLRNIDSIRLEAGKYLVLHHNGNKVMLRLADIESLIFALEDCDEISIGNQVWKCKNLDVDHYLNGDSIPEVRDSIEWSNLKTGAWCYYNNDPELGKIYGKLYNWYAFNDPRGLAPEGWRIPSYNDWQELVNYLGATVAGGKLKVRDTLFWFSPYSKATNESGFGALPGGSRDDSWGSFSDLKYFGDWWTSKPFWGFRVYNDYDGTGFVGMDPQVGISIRCIKGISPVIDSIIPHGASVGDVIKIYGKNLKRENDSTIVYFNNSYSRDFVNMKEDIIILKVPVGSKCGELFLISNGLQSNRKNFLVIHNYNPDESFIDTVRICQQTWMRKNLNTSYYRNGDSIRQCKTSEEWIDAGAKGEGAWCYFGNDTILGKIFGKLYNWYAVNDPRGLAPEGWHIPSDNEFWDIQTCLGGFTSAGGQMKEAGNEHWYINDNASNASGFNGLPSGLRQSNGEFHDLSLSCRMWTTSGANHGFIKVRYMHYSNSLLDYIDFSKDFGAAVRCVKDNK